MTHAPDDSTISASEREMIERAKAQARSAAKAQRKGLIGALTEVASSIPGYEVLGQAKRGGQGVVYRARQESTKREVAIKVLIEGAATSYAEAARFEREVQILAQLRHPHIVAVHDSGQSSGHFYCVMDFIEGQSLDDYVAQHELDTRERLTLFAEICEAVNAAHLMGVIHRDLKPSNIRVDEEGHPHILDFGLAKTTGDSFAESPSAMTMSGQFLGSLHWASPEQAEGGASRIDTRTDVYSLGVIAYHMLTGRFPYDVEGSMKQILNNIVDIEPMKLRTVDRTISPDVEAIVMKALAKERDRRYQTAGELARDMRRYLTGDAIEARGDSTAYIMQKMLRKHWPVVATAAAFIALVIGFGITMTILREVAVKQREIAEMKTEESKAGFDTIVAAIERANPEREGSRDVLLRDVLENIGASAEENLAEHPVPLARVHDMLGQCFEGLSELPLAEASFQRALELRVGEFGETDRATIMSMNALAVFYKQKNTSIDKAAPLFDRISAALPTLQRGTPRDQRDVAAIHMNLARWYESRSDNERAAEHYRSSIDDLEGLQERQDERARAFAAGNFGNFLTRQGEYEEAEQRLQECIVALITYRGEDHPEPAIAKVKLAYLYRKQERFDEAEQMYRQAIDVLATKMPGHPSTLATQSHLYEVVVRRDGYEQGLSIIEALVAAARGALGEEHPDTVLYVGKLGKCQAQLGDDTSARANLDFACTRLRDIRKNPCHSECVEFTKELVAVCERLGDDDAAAIQKAILDECDLEEDDQ